MKYKYLVFDKYINDHIIIYEVKDKLTLDSLGVIYFSDKAEDYVFESNLKITYTYNYLKELSYFIKYLEKGYDNEWN